MHLFHSKICLKSSPWKQARKGKQHATGVVSTAHAKAESRAHPQEYYKAILGLSACHTD